MNQITESAIEEFAIELLEKSGYQYVYVPDIAPDSDTPGGVEFTTVQKSQPKDGDVYPKLSDRRNILTITDEAHRTQYSFKVKTIDTKDEQGINSKQIRTLKKLWDTLLPKLMSGQVRIQYGQEATI